MDQEPSSSNADVPCSFSPLIHTCKHLESSLACGRHSLSVVMCELNITDKNVKLYVNFITTCNLALPYPSYPPVSSVTKDTVKFYVTMFCLIIALIIYIYY